ncbi:hypothetical protein EJB05_46794, partial [Eragrostis curvula]
MTSRLHILKGHQKSLSLSLSLSLSPLSLVFLYPLAPLLPQSSTKLLLFFLLLISPNSRCLLNTYPTSTSHREPAFLDRDKPKETQTLSIQITLDNYRVQQFLSKRRQAGEPVVDGPFGPAGAAVRLVGWPQDRAAGRQRTGAQSGRRRRARR